MKREDIIRMAREASFIWDEMGLLDRLAFYKFADLVAAAEQEACAKVCEARADEEVGMAYEGIALDCAAAIRARSNP